MPGLPQRNVQFNSNNNNAYSTTCSTGSISSNRIWSKHPDDISFDQLQKVGFFSGRKRESIFKSPDDPKGKVGITGSGKGLTDFQRREKHLHIKAGGAETDE